MENQKYTVGQTGIMLIEIGGQRLPLFEVEIIGFEPENENPYKIRYLKRGDTTFWIDDVDEGRLISLIEIASSSKGNP